MADESRELVAYASFPFRGIDKSRDTFTQPEGTSPEGTNVRAFVRHRMRGGSRAGLSRYIDEKVNGDNAIQHLNVIVSAHADALGWSANGRDFGFTGVYGGIGFVTGPAGSDEADFPEGGGGYGTQRRDRFTLTLSVDDNEVLADGVSDATLTAHLEDEEGSPPPTAHTIEFRTNIGGRVGDRVQGQTDASGNVQANVTNTREESVLYSARDITGRVKSESVKVTWVPESNVKYMIFAYIDTNMGGAGAATAQLVIRMNGTIVDTLSCGSPVFDDYQTIRFSAASSTLIDLDDLPAELVSLGPNINAAFQTTYASEALLTNPGSNTLRLVASNTPSGIGGTSVEWFVLLYKMTLSGGEYVFTEEKVNQGATESFSFDREVVFALS